MIYDGEGPVHSCRIIFHLAKCLVPAQDSLTQCGSGSSFNYPFIGSRRLAFAIALPCQSYPFPQDSGHGHSCPLESRTVSVIICIRARIRRRSGCCSKHDSRPTTVYIKHRQETPCQRTKDQGRRTKDEELRTKDSQDVNLNCRQTFN